MKLVVAEKPSVMRDIAAVLGATQKNANGALCGNGYMVTSARGHLVRLKQPNEYDKKYENRSLSDLPINPKFEFTPISGAENQLKILAELMNSADIEEIIEATDAGREGECIFRYIYNYVGCTKPVKRLWISSLTSESIRQGFNNLLDYADKDSTFEAGFARAKVDWLWGINLSRLYAFYCGAKCRIGRVKMPTVNMIVQRDREIAAFVKKPYFKLKLDNGAEWFDDDQDCFAERSEAESIKAKCENQPCKVVSVNAKQKKENRPLLFSLTSLQVEANDKLGFSAATTLAVMQSLYEKKLLTYPRTDSNYLTEDMASIIEERVSMLRVMNEAADEVLAAGLNIDSRIINDSKVSDHHAIIPTENIGGAASMELSANEKAILDMVITRFLAALSPQYEYTETDYVFEVSKERFRCRTKAPRVLGWKRFYTDNDAENQAALNFSEGDSFEAKNLTISECETQPPKHFTESTLLKAMENIDRRIEDKELSEYVSERGLGTPATRAAIIEEIIATGYIERKGKTLSATDIGCKIIDMLPDVVKSVVITAEMEQHLAAIENGNEIAENVIATTIDTIVDIIKNEEGRNHISLEKKEPIGKCPKCGGGVYEYTKNGNTIYYCENSSLQRDNPCIFRVFSNDWFWKSKRKKLDIKTLQKLLEKGKVKVIGLYSEQKNKKYDAVISFGNDWIDKTGKSHIGFKIELAQKGEGGK